MVGAATCMHSDEASYGLRLGLLCLVLAACGAETLPEVAATATAMSPIINGADASDSVSDAVGALLVTHDAGPAMTAYRPMCSGTLIAPQIVLTAAHCVVDTGFVADSGAVYFGDVLEGQVLADLLRHGPVSAVQSVVVHPDYSALTYVNDIALIKLLGTPRNVPVLPPLPSSLGMTAADVGGYVTLIGFGLTDAYFVGSETDMTGRHRVQAPIRQVCSRIVGCDPIGPRTFAYDHVAVTDFADGIGGACSGDSGGAALVYRGGVVYVAGVTSTVFAPWLADTEQSDCMQADFGVETDVSAFEPWLQPLLAQLNPCATATDDCDPLVACTPGAAGTYACGPCPAGYVDGGDAPVTFCVEDLSPAPLVAATTCQSTRPDLGALTVMVAMACRLARRPSRRARTRATGGLVQAFRDPLWRSDRWWWGRSGGAGLVVQETTDTTEGHVVGNA